LFAAALLGLVVVPGALATKPGPGTSTGTGRVFLPNPGAELQNQSWDIHNALGNVRADTIILQGQIDFPGTSMKNLANRYVATAQQLYGNAAANQVTTAFKNRGIL
jgi:hypothetical protein